jgi:hypothetical protein
MAVVWSSGSSGSKGTWRLDISGRVLKLSDANGAVPWQQPAASAQSVPSPSTEPSTTTTKKGRRHSLACI